VGAQIRPRHPIHSGHHLLLRQHCVARLCSARSLLSSLCVAGDATCCNVCRSACETKSTPPFSPYTPHYLPFSRCAWPPRSHCAKHTTHTHHTHTHARAYTARRNRRWVAAPNQQLCTRLFQRSMSTHTDVLNTSNAASDDGRDSPRIETVSPACSLGDAAAALTVRGATNSLSISLSVCI
jgi:hypothetical protein